MKVITKAEQVKINRLQVSVWRLRNAVERRRGLDKEDSPDCPNDDPLNYLMDAMVSLDEASRYYEDGEVVE